jgi:hypothetical protein
LRREEPDERQREQPDQRREYEENGNVAVLEVFLDQILVQMGGDGPKDRTGKGESEPGHRCKLKVAERLARSAPTGRNSLGVAPVVCGEPFRSDERLQNVTPRPATGLIQVKVIAAKAR